MASTGTPSTTPLDPTSVLQAYAELSEPPREQAILTVLRRYNLAWLSNRLAEARDLPTSTESLGGHAFDPGGVGDVFRTPLFYRLAFLKQLSTVALVSHLDATHTRLSHAIGAANVASEILARVEATSPVAFVRELSPVWKKACLFYCFIHDAFHGPMGHSLDMMRSALGLSLEDKVDDAQFREALRSAVARGDDPIGYQVRLAASRVLEGDVDGLLDKVGMLADPARLRNEEPNAYFLRDIVTSTVDADRLDYLIRDAHLLDGTDLRQDFRTLVRSATAIPEDGVVRLAFSGEQRRVVERALGTRRKLYSQHYEAAPKLILDDMLCHGIYYVLSELGLAGEEGTGISEQDRTTAIRHLLLLTDGDLIPALGEFRASPAAYDLLERVLQRRYFVEFYRVPMRYSETDRIFKEFSGWMEEISAAADELAREREKKTYPAAADPEYDLPRFQAITERHLERAQDADQVLAFGLQKQLGGSFEDRLIFERRAWARFCREHDASEDLRHGYLDAETGSSTSEKLGSLSVYPPLHVTTTSSFDIEGREDVMGYLKEGGSGDRKGVLLYTGNVAGEYSAVRERIRTEIMEDEPVLPLLMSAPAKLVEHAGGSLQQAVLDELRSCWWLWQLTAKPTA